MRITRTAIITALAAGVIAMGIACLCTMRAYSDETTQTLHCKSYWTQPMREVCESETMVCIRDFGNSDFTCQLRPVKE